eukprot:Gb_19301 [translate_table: standard]
MLSLQPLPLSDFLARFGRDFLAGFEGFISPEDSTALLVLLLVEGDLNGEGPEELPTRSQGFGGAVLPIYKNNRQRYNAVAILKHISSRSMTDEMPSPINLDLCRLWETSCNTYPYKRRLEEVSYSSSLLVFCTLLPLEASNLLLERIFASYVHKADLKSCTFCKIVVPSPTEGCHWLYATFLRLFLKPKPPLLSLWKAKPLLGVSLPSATAKSRLNPSRSCKISLRPHLASVFASKLRRNCRRSTID